MNSLYNEIFKNDSYIFLITDISNYKKEVLQKIIFKKEFVIDYLNNCNNIINNMNEYSNYILINEISNYGEELTEIMNEKDYSYLMDIVKLAKKVNLKYNKTEVTKFILNNYKEIFDVDNNYSSEKYNIKECTINYLPKLVYDEKVYIYLIKNYILDILINYDILKNYFDKNITYYYDVILTEDNLNEYVDEFEGIFLKIYRKVLKTDKSFIDEKANLLCTIAKKEINKDKSYNNYFKLNAICNILKTLKHPYVLKLERIVNCKKEELNKSVFSVGMNIFSTDEISNKLKTSYDKYLNLTHIIQNNNFISKFEYINSLNKISDEFISSFPPSSLLSDVYTYSFINGIEYILDFERKELKRIFESNRMPSLIDKIISNTYLTINMQTINYDIDIDIDLLSFIRLKRDNTKLDLYSTINLLIGNIEKIIRKYYIKLHKEKEYIDTNYLTLSTLLEKNIIKNKFDESLIICIKYYLLSFNDFNKKYRHIVAHYNDNIKSILNIDTVLNITYILFSICNTIISNEII